MKLLIVDDEPNMRHMLRSLIERHGYKVETAENGMIALEAIRTYRFDFILCDVKMPEIDGLSFLKQGGADKIIHINHDLLERYHGELFANVFFDAAQKDDVSCVLIAGNEGTSDLGAKIAAMMNAPLVTKAMDFGFDDRGRGIAVRPVSNGYQFERMIIKEGSVSVISYLPSVLSAAGDFKKKDDTPVEVITPDIDVSSLNTKIINVIDAEPENLDIEDADIVVAGGRGAGKGDEFNIIHELAKEIGGSVGGTRPVIDGQLLPFERQIGQTGKTIVPGLIINCGISGANEYSAGMEKAKRVISINICLGIC